MCKTLKGKPKRIQSEHFNLCISKEDLLLCGAFKTTKKENGSENRKSANSHICGRPTNLTNFEVHKFATLRFAEFICEPPKCACMASNVFLWVKNSKKLDVRTNQSGAWSALTIKVGLYGPYLHFRVCYMRKYPSFFVFRNSLMNLSAWKAYG